MALMYDRPKEITETEFTRRMEPFVKDLVTVEQGWAQLKKFVHDHINRLQERMELMSYREERQLNAAIGSAQSACDRDGEKRERYAAQSDRTFNAAVRLLLALKQERRKHGDRSGSKSIPPMTLRGSLKSAIEIRNPKRIPPIPDPRSPGSRPQARASRSGLWPRGNGPPAGCHSGRQGSKSERT